MGKSEGHLGHRASFLLGRTEGRRGEKRGQERKQRMGRKDRGMEHGRAREDRGAEGTMSLSIYSAALPGPVPEATVSQRILSVLVKLSI